MKKTIKLFYPQGDWLDTRIRDEVISQYDYSDDDHELEDFHEIRNKLCEKYRLTRDEMTIINEDEHCELSYIIRGNQEGNGENIFKEKASVRLSKLNDIFDYGDLDDEVKLKGFKPEWENMVLYVTYELKKGEETTQDLLTDYQCETMAEFFNDEVPEEIEVERAHLESISRYYPVDGDEIFEEYCRQLDKLNTKEILANYYKKQAKHHQDKTKEMMRKYVDITDKIFYQN